MAALELNSIQSYTEVLDQMHKDHKDVNVFALSQIEKISINIGVGKYDAKQQADIAEHLSKITGNTPKLVPSRVSIAGFKLRKGAIVGLVSTLRGKKMRDFLTLLVFVALPRTRDFRGIKIDSFDANGKVYSLGIPSAAIFPQVGFDATVQFGMQINIVFKNNSPLNKELLTKLNFPFKRD